MATTIPINRCEFSLAELTSATGGRLFGEAPAGVRGVSIDTRSLEPGNLFVALRGADDGHNFLESALERGASAAVVEIGRRRPGLACIEVADTLDALGCLARLHLARIRASNSLPVIAIGGAAGKTTTKELTSACVRALFGATLSTVGNLNNLIGVPMTIFNLTTAHRAAVIECGTNTRGEIPKLAQIVQPDVATVLNVDLEHTEGLGTLDDVADEEASLFSTARRFAVTSAEEPMVLARIPAGLSQITFGKSRDADVRLSHRAVVSGGRSRIRVDFSPALVAAGVIPVIETEIALLGEAAALNCGAAIAGALAMYSSRVSTPELEAISAALASVNPVPGRLATESIHGIFVIDDTYNSNPRSIRAALASAREVTDGLATRLVIAMGDMLELGAMSRDAHEKLVRDLLRQPPAEFVAVGPELSAALTTQLGIGLRPGIHLAPDSAAAGLIVKGLVREGDVLLVKGSRGIAMERVIDALR